MSAPAPLLDGWMPIRIFDRDGPMVDWCFVGSEPLTEPFFDGAIERHMRLPFNAAFRQETTLESLRERYEREPGIAPDGLIFHVSRCGSTLVSQMLRALDDTIVLSEAEPIDGVLRYAAGAIDAPRRAEWLRWIVAAMSQPRAGNERRLFIKHDGWQTLDFEVIRRAFPTTPCVFVYRDPLEILVSQMRQRAMVLIPGVLGADVSGVSLERALAMPADEFAATVLAAIFDGMVRHASAPGVALVNYFELPQDVAARVLPHVGVAATPAERMRMDEVTRRDAKSPAFPFAPDGDRKRQAAGDRIRALCAVKLDTLYAKLETIRAERAADLR